MKLTIAKVQNSRSVEQSLEFEVDDYEARRRRSIVEADWAA